MPIKFHPGVGQVLYCDFDAGGFQPPEMVKSRPVIVLSRSNKSDICTVVPLSGTVPNPVLPHHHKINPDSLPQRVADKGEWWVKGDMIATVGFFRLDRVKEGRNHHGKRQYSTKKVSKADLLAVKMCVIHALCMNDLTSGQQ
ncbi:type II toxin-antitoxin system PemK/MazF family toxin [Bremerella alba]|uniref:Type II toxin-antitoxin system PemK/MazF family toxin n=1 Tax=Bremerella alba TaxID=980252 RepID=A0A7V8V8C8_9BACT|nr:type II toxin-antitoxin system PemK/MazF family toxin [Bremerella alba]MBA2116824.1 hypothetical protein [Bremerella alba]